MVSSLSKTEMLVNSVLPQIVAQIGSVMTFEAETTSHDANTISVAQKICDRFLKSVREIAVAKIARLRDCKIAFADKLRDIMKGLNVEPQNPQRPAAAKG